MSQSLSNLDAKGLLTRFSNDRVTMLYVNTETLLLVGGDVANGQSNGRMAMLTYLWGTLGAWGAKTCVTQDGSMIVGPDFDVFEDVDMNELFAWLRGER